MGIAGGARVGPTGGGARLGAAALRAADAGDLWIDDLHIAGETNSKSARLNAQHTLLAALQAYREQRYADFARLAGSHWVRESGPAASRLAGLPRLAPKAGAGGSADAAGFCPTARPQAQVRSWAAGLPRPERIEWPARSAEPCARARVEEEPDVRRL